jgi:hypothetical protein
MTFYGRAEVPVSFIVRVIRSTDGGKTWSEPTVVPSPFKTVTATSSPAIELTDGTLLLPIYGRDTPSRYNEDKPGLRDRSVVLRSADDGKTWDAPVFIVDAPEVHLQEPSILQLDNGRILCLYYVEERPGSRIRQAVFRVNGETITCESSTLLQ